MTPQLEEALRLMRIARRDQETFGLLLPLEAASLSALGFHAQQAVEKSLKAIVALRNIEMKRTHNLAELVRVLQEEGESVPLSIEEVLVINPFAVEFRYDDEIIPVISREELKMRMDRIMDWAESRTADQLEGKA